MARLRRPAAQMAGNLRRRRPSFRISSHAARQLDVGGRVIMHEMWTSKPPLVAANTAADVDRLLYKINERSAGVFGEAARYLDNETSSHPAPRQHCSYVVRIRNVQSTQFPTPFLCVP